METGGMGGEVMPALHELECRSHKHLKTPLDTPPLRTIGLLNRASALSESKTSKIWEIQSRGDSRNFLTMLGLSKRARFDKEIGNDFGLRDIATCIGSNNS